MRNRFLEATCLLTFVVVLAAVMAAQQSSTPPAKTPSSTKSSTASTASTKPHTTTSTAAKTAQPLKLTTPTEKVSYSLGMNIGQNMKRDGVDLDPAILERGIKDVLAGKTLLTDDEMRAALTDLRNQLNEKKLVEAKQAGAANKQAGDQFLAANKTKEGVITLPSGLQYKILKEGTGPKPTASDTVVCNYRGTLLDGTEFDSSYKRGQPATFPVGQVIKGWTEALQLMPVGSQWQLFIPPDLAYGERSPGPEIGPNSTLIFQIDLLSIQGQKPAQEQKQ